MEPNSQSSLRFSSLTALNILNLVAYIANVGLVNGVPYWFNLPDNAELSKKYQTIVTPAGWAFAIWGLIFLAQAIWSVLQFTLPAIRSNALVVEGVGYCYVGVCFFQVAWTFAFGTEQIGLSMVCMLGILYFLMIIYSRQEKILHDDHNSFSKNYWLLRFPFGLHLGWIVAATLVNANVVLVARGAPATLQYYAGLVSLALTLIVTAGVIFQQSGKTYPDVVIPVVLAWALNAISKELNNPKELIVATFTSSQIVVIMRGAFTAALLVLASALGSFVYALLKHRMNNTNENRPGGERLLDQQ